MSRSPPQSYLLRLWRERPGAPVRATLVAVGQPEVHQHFATLEALCAFLRAQGDPTAVTTGPKAHRTPEWDCTHCTPDDRQ